MRNLRISVRKKIANEIIAILNKDCTENSHFSEKFDLDSSKQYSPDEGLGLIEQVKLSKYQFHFIRLQAKERNVDIDPSCKKILESKKECCPPNIYMTEEGGNVEIKSLINHTVKRLFLDPVLNLPITNSNSENVHLNFEIKYGIGGLSTNSKYNQKFDNKNLSDASIINGSHLLKIIKLIRGCMDELAYFLSKTLHANNVKIC